MGVKEAEGNFTRVMRFYLRRDPPNRPHNSISTQNHPLTLLRHQVSKTFNLYEPGTNIKWRKKKSEIIKDVGSFANI